MSAPTARVWGHFSLTKQMTSKYAQFDKKLFAWLRSNRENVTTVLASSELAPEDKTKQRRISRMFTKLEDRGVLKCTLHGTLRQCTVVTEIPESLSKQPWRKQISQDVGQHQRLPVVSAHTAVPIPANNSYEFEQAGGIIERLPGCSAKPLRGSRPTGSSFSFDE